MITSKRVRLGFKLGLLAQFLLICIPPLAHSAIRGSVVYYVPNPNDAARRQFVAQRYEAGIIDKGDGLDAANIRALNPNFRWFNYNSITDNYVYVGDGGENDQLIAKANARGWDPEEGYMHYWDDTQIVLENQTITIPGWGGGSATNPVQARVPVYYANLSRRLTNFSTGRARQLHKEVMVGLSFDTTFRNATIYPDGIFLDNATSTLYNYGQINSGGHVRETPGHLLIGSAAFQTWYWNSNLGPFMSALHDTVATGAVWSRDHRPKYTMANVANSWQDTFTTWHVADILAMEFQYDPIRNDGVNSIQDAYNRDAAATAVGMQCWNMSNTTSSTSYGGSYSKAEALMGGLTWYLVSRTENTLLQLFGNNTVVSEAGWDTLTWRGFCDVASSQLGNPVGAPYVLQQGTDPLGNAYKVWARDYSNGLAICRNRGSWNQGVTTGTAVTLNLPRSLQPVLAATSQLGAATSSWSIRNGQGAFFLNAGPPDLVAPGAVSNLAVTGTTYNSASLSWTTPGDDGTTGTPNTFDVRYSTAPITGANFASATAASGEPTPQAAGATQTMTVTGLSSSTTYYFAIKAGDEAGNWGAASNSPSGATPAPPADTTPPAAVGNLAVGSPTTTSLAVSWTAPGDDNAAGTATTYDLRYSTSTITAANFASATAVSGEPTPAAAGAAQSMTVSGLSAGTTYYFALKTADEIPNWSTISNVPSGATSSAGGPDTAPPSAVTNLAVTTTTASTASLSWTAPGDDGGNGTAAQYDVRYSTTPITGANFGTATAVSGEPTPVGAGGTQTLTVSGLTAGTTYYFALLTADEVPNWSNVSNVPSGTTTAGGGADTTPPAAVTNLAATGIGRHSLTLNWTVPGDDGTTGQAYRYAFAFSTAPINAGNFWQSNAIYRIPTPVTAGTQQSQSVEGLDAGTTYYFAMMTTDEVFNYSGLSNVPTATTLPPPATGDTTPPAGVTDLRVTATTNSSVTVTWTAPGDDGASGTATTYDMHYSLVNITPANYAGARIATGLPTPSAAGTQQSVTISGLSQGTGYYFALRAIDENDNWSAVSNTTSGTPGTPPPSDPTPPAAVGNLALTAPTTTSLTVSWAAPGDDGSTGTATSYDLRYSTTLITAANFGSATAVAGEPAPGAPGATQSKVVSGLSAGTTYYFALKTGDEVPNWSAISNVPSGATTAAPPPTDTTPPAAVTNLALGSPTTTSLFVSWNAPGDDGSAGTASTYDLRYSTSAITAANFGSATAVAGEPTPGAAGGAQSMTVTGLAVGTTYFFALKTADEAPNWSALSNTPSAATTAAGPPPDTTPPAAVSNLAVGSPTTSSLTVSWTAPGDDGSTGAATTYDLRYSTSAITAANFAAATAAIGEPAPAAAGSAQSMGIAGLASGTKYYFALKTGDEVPNWSAISNLPSGTTTTPGDVTPPAAVTNLAITNVGNTTVTVSWTAPGDDGTTGTATQYDMRLAAFPITAANFGTADFVTTEPVPAAAGTSQSCTISGLGAGYTYYFALKTRDEVSNWSSLSNTATATTIALPPPDTTPPSSILDLKSTGVTHQTISVSWTSPGDDGNVGRATTYDLRYSQLPITDQNFNAATLVSGEPAPGVAGTAQTMTVRGLSSRKTYYFALKAADEVPNWSTLSNPLTAATIDPPPVPDAIAPATVSDLALSAPTEASLTVGWTAPGDDDNLGQATIYDLRYSTTPITAQNFDLATLVANPPAPAQAGTPESMVVGGLTGGTLYYFALKTGDEVPNWSAVSNFVSGATAAPPPPPDTTAPGAVLNLAVESTTNSGVTLSWSAPGDDQDSGQAAGYDLRYSEAPLGLATFEAAAQVTGEPTPLPAGGIQSFSVEGLNPGVTYHFALRTVDEAGNWSSLSNVPAGTTQQEAGGDTTPPSAVNNLLVGSATQTSLTVSWSAPGDDGLAGVAGSYDLRYSNVAITGVNFAAATPVAGEPTPAAAGTTQSIVVTGLNPAMTYYFALKTADEVPNWSGISNVSSGATQNAPPPDTTPPGTTNTLAAGSATATSLTLSWLAPGDDGNVGIVAGYDVRISRSIITPSNFGQATAVTGAPNPRNAGSLQSLPVSGLDPNTTYYFALKSTDDVGNVSAMSNVAGGTTLLPPPPPDHDPPAVVSSLSVTAESPTRVTVSWTAPGDDAGTGVAAAYDLRYSTNAATAAAFDGATALAGEPTPTAPGSTQSLTLQGLAEGTTYHFVLKTADEVPNWSAVSNVASVTTPVSPPPPDTAPPSTVADLHITAIGETTVQLEWSAPADDGAASPAHHYDVRYSSVEINNDNFGNASPVANPPAPLAPGQPQSMAVIELLPDVTYYFALKSYDEAGNASLVSNLVTATTLTPPPPPPVDTTPPAGVPALQVVAATQTSLTLAWGAPGDDGDEGTATAYDLRYRVGEFTAADFDLASEVQGEPTPGAAGAAESFTLTGLSAGTSYRFALRTVDEAGNWSDISNVAVGATEGAPPPPPPGDTTPPATTGLTLVSAGADTAVLSWVAPGDDTTFGRASLLAMRLDVLPITDDRWAQALVVVGLPQPAAAGTVQQVTVYGLLPSTLYYFAFRARDDAGNWSDVGPSLDVKTQDQIDTSPPLAPAGLNGKPEAGQVDLYWDGSPDPTVVGYHVYRRVGTAAWERLNRALLQATTYTDQLPEAGAHYDYAVTAVNSHGQESPKSASYSVAIPGETIADLAVVVPPTPNPFRQSMSLAIVVPAARADNVFAAVFDVRGALVRILHEGALPAGEQSFTWDGRGANGTPARAGIYFVKLRGGARTLTHKVVLTR